LPEEEAYPEGAYRQAAGVTRMLLKASVTHEVDIHSPATFYEYYRSLYDLVDPQNRNEELIEAIKGQDFSEVARQYRLIKQDAINALVPYDRKSYGKLQKEVRRTGLTREWIVGARPYSIGIFRPRPDDPVWPYLDAVPVSGGAASDEWFVYLNRDHYSQETGLVPPESTECLIA
jgi:hypothetical protein